MDDLLPFRARDFSRRLLRWFDSNKRDLPWRRTRDPYAIWVSEVMLQQTQVATVARYFTRFLQTFASIEDLASADEGEVLRVWEGLGYYRRARALHRAANMIVSEHKGRFPDRIEDVCRLPGIGRYTAGAILSQAFDQRHPVLEANTRRLLCRLFAIEQPLRDKAIEKQLWRFAEAMLPHERCGDFNQALMELGALVCKPQKPACQHCPVNRYCLACQRKLQNSIPSGRKKRTIPVHEVALVARRADSFLLVRRPAKGRWSNMWEFPHGSVDNGQSLEQAAAQLLGELTGLRGRIGEPFFSLTHGVMHYRIRLNCFVVDRVRGKFSSSFYPAHQWVLPGEFDQYPLSSPQRRLADCVLKLFGSKRSEQNAQ